jgi:hypothetical protein
MDNGHRNNNFVHAFFFLLQFTENKTVLDNNWNETQQLPTKYAILTVKFAVVN